MTALLDEHGTKLREIGGVGPVLAARLLGRSGDAALKRHLASRLWRVMLADDNRTAREPSESAANAS